MSIVFFPFNTEPPHQVLANASIALSSPAVSEVVLVGADNATHGGEIAALATEGISIVTQRRIGSLRPGKGDGVNTAFDYFLDSGAERMHLFDTDITSFGPEWIGAGERGLDEGFDVVRHAYWRAATDGMITWMITRPMLALRFPDHTLSRLRQPLGGELTLTRSAVESLAMVESVRSRSDWGIDTALSQATAALGLGVLESFRADGKEHSLYGTLDELRTMVIECFEAVADLPQSDLGEGRFSSEAPTPPSDAIRAAVGYDVAATARRVREPLGGRSSELLGEFPSSVRRRIVAMTEGNLAALNASTWHQTLIALTENYRLGDPEWQELLFRLWEARVLSYTASMAGRSYAEAMDYLDKTIEAFSSAGRARA